MSKSKEKLKKLAAIAAVLVLPGGVLLAIALVVKKKRDKNAKLP
jgi:hypothetical protein